MFLEKSVAKEGQLTCWLFDSTWEEERRAAGSSALVKRVNTLRKGVGERVRQGLVSEEFNVARSLIVHRSREVKPCSAKRSGLRFDWNPRQCTEEFHGRHMP